MQVLYFSPTIWGNTDFYRTTGVLPFINHPDINLRDISHFGGVSQYDLGNCDIIIVQRPCTPDHLNLIKMAKALGKNLIVDYDDDVLNVNMFNPTFIQYQQQRDIILEIIDIVDEVWVSTMSIASSFGRGIVIPNALNDYLLDPCAPYNTDSNVIVWRGSSAHEADIYDNPDVIVDMVHSHPELAFYFIGHRFTYLEQRCGDNFNSVESMPITKYFQYLKQLKPKAMIFPLQDTVLNRGKSAISWYEATWAGSAYFGNTNLPEFEDKGGVLELNLFEKNIYNSNTLEFAHNSSRSYIEENLLLSKINKLRINSLLSL